MISIVILMTKNVLESSSRIKKILNGEKSGLNVNFLTKYQFSKIMVSNVILMTKNVLESSSRRKKHFKWRKDWFKA